MKSVKILTIKSIKPIGRGKVRITFSDKKIKPYDSYPQNFAGLSVGMEVELKKGKIVKHS